MCKSTGLKWPNMVKYCAEWKVLDEVENNYGHGGSTMRKDNLTLEKQLLPMWEDVGNLSCWRVMTHLKWLHEVHDYWTDKPIEGTLSTDEIVAAVERCGYLYAGGGSALHNKLEEMVIEGTMIVDRDTEMYKLHPWRGRG